MKITRSITLAFVFVATTLLVPVSSQAQNFGAHYICESEDCDRSYYCLRTKDGMIYAKLDDWMKQVRENPNSWALLMDSMVTIAQFDQANQERIHFQFMLGDDDAVFVSKNPLQQYFSGVDSTEITHLTFDSLAITYLSDQHFKYEENVPRIEIRQTIVTGDTTLPAIHPLNFQFPEIQYLPKVIISSKHTWHLNEVFYDQARIDDLLSILRHDDIRLITDDDVSEMIQTMGMTKQEWWVYIKQMAAAEKEKK